ncbi:MAG: hypothetical protein JWO06_2833 [Bacteroidota bacterium]|nr:hypothetical protein [Bacteroidota bacterium]
MALKYIGDLLKVFIYYLVLFALCRLIFLLYFSQQIIGEGVGIFFNSLIKAFPLDLSTACYLSFLPLAILFIRSVWAQKFFTWLLKVYLLFTSLVYILLAIGEIGVYREVHVKLYFNLLTHLSHVDELFRSVSFALMITVLGTSAVLLYFAGKGLNKIFPAKKRAGRTRIIDVVGLLLVLLVSTGLMFMGCRGGLQPIPINEGEVYFSDNQCVNDATVNPLWNIVHSYIENKLVLKGDAYKVMSDDEASAIVADLYHVEKDSTVHIFKTGRPNVCILILESWSADLIESLGGYKGLTPNFEKLVNEGYLFTNIKPAGHVSDQGVPAILSGYPALPIGSAVNQPERQVNLDCLNDELLTEGYTSSFFFGGQLIYGNLKSYVYRNKFMRVVEQQDLPSSLPAGRLGIHDSIMLGIWRDSLNQMKQPFFSCLFTLSTHSPYDAGRAESVDWGDMEKPYLNSVVYADRQLGKFFEEAKKQAWYNNTVFILVADHSHNTPKNYQYCTPEFYHIPLLIYGGALKEEYRGVKSDRLGSQTDIASTLLHQLNLKAGSYRWSKDLMNPYTKQFAFYTFNEGFGYVDSGRVTVWNKKFPYLTMNSGTTPAEKDSLFKKGAATLQVLMKDFLSK